MKAIYTVCSPSHIAQAKTLVESVLRHNPGYTAFICLFNSDSFSLQALEEFGLARIIDIDKTGVESYEKMRKQYNPFELSCALRPYMAEHIFSTYSPEHLLYFDSDIQVLHPLFENGFPDKDMCITAHSISRTLWDDGVAEKARYILERGLLKSGIYNSGFVYFKNSPASHAFLKWWKYVLLDGAYNNSSMGLFVDQLWVNLLPVYFKDQVEIITAPGYNVAYWNMDERTVEKVADQYIVKTVLGDSGPLVFFHFSGYHLQADSKITIYESLYDFESRPALAGLFSQYREAVLNNGHLLYSEKYKIKLSIQRKIRRKIRKGINMLLRRK